MRTGYPYWAHLRAGREANLIFYDKQLDEIIMSIAIEIGRDPELQAHTTAIPVHTCADGALRRRHCEAARYHEASILEFFEYTVANFILRAICQPYVFRNRSSPLQGASGEGGINIGTWTRTTLDHRIKGDKQPNRQPCDRSLALIR